MLNLDSIKNFIDWFENKFKTKIGGLIITFFIGLTLGGCGIYFVWLWGTTQVKDKEAAQTKVATLELENKELTNKLFTIKDQAENDCLSKMRDNYLFIQSFVESVNNDNSNNQKTISENNKSIAESKKILQELKQIQQNVN